MSPWRTESGGRIDRTRTLGFTFNGRRLEAHPGDTLASALLANGVHLVGRSFKYHRPRGIFSCGAEEPNALVQFGSGSAGEPNIRATQIEVHEGLNAASQNCWPSVGTDIGAVNDLLSPLLPAGFYYKTFMWPASAWMWYERHIRRAAGLGRVPEGRDPDRYDHMHAHCDVLVVGGGAAGLAAARAARGAGARVMLVDEQSEPGGYLLGAQRTIEGRPALQWVADALAELRSDPAVTLLSRTTLTGYYDHNYLVAVERVTDHLSVAERGSRPRQRLWKVRARQVVLATGAIERPVVFGQNDRPGIMLAGAVAAYLNRYGVRCGLRAVLVTNHDETYRSALELAGAGVEVRAIVDLRADPQGIWPERVRQRGIEVLPGAAITGTGGRLRVSGVRVESAAGGRVRSLDCDVVGMSGGLVPTVHLFSQSRGRVHYDPALGAFVPGEATQPLRCAGACNGTFGLAASIGEGWAAGAAAARDAGARGDVRPLTVECDDASCGPAEPPTALPRVVRRRDKQFVDFQNDVTAADVELAAREGYLSVEHLKRYTTTGMGTDQGKTSNLNALALLAGARDAAIGDVGTTTFRPPYTPLAFGAVAGMAAGPLFDPVRSTPMHDWHVGHGARFEDVGQWKRPWYYPRPGESMQDAVSRECLAARRGVAIVDASTLGKIDIQGPDAAVFLDRVYTNRFSTLAVGRARYGLMLKQDGMVFDDGVTTRLGPEHFLMSTTTGGAARVLAWLEEWLQTEWPELHVWCTSVTEQYAVASLSGPRSRDVVAAVAPDLALDDFPFMAVREAVVAGIPARVFRISFTGDLGYEIAVPSSQGRALWDALMRAGATHDITPYGTEAMHVLRAEKGFIIVGQETDGTVTPVDLGLGAMVAKDKDFIGRRSLSRADTVRADRKQLVGLLTEDPAIVLPEGAQIVAELEPRPPMAMVGHVTSAYYSANAGRSIALALVKGGRDRMGATLHVPLADRTLEVTVCAPAFLDRMKEGARG